MRNFKEEKARENWEAEHGPPDAEEQADVWLQGKSPAEVKELMNRRAEGEEIEGMPLPYHLGHAFERQLKAEVANRKVAEDAEAKKAYEGQLGIKIPKDIDWHQVKKERDARAGLVMWNAKRLEVPPQTEAELLAQVAKDLEGAEERIKQIKTAYALHDRFGKK